MEWNYKSNDLKTTGYEDVIGKMNIVTPEEFRKMSDDEKDIIVNNIFEIIREKNIFPIYYFNDEGIKKEIQKCIEKEVKLENNVLNVKDISGQHLCNFLFPNLHHVDCKGTKNNSMWDRFYDDYKLKRTIKFTLTYEPIKNSYTSLYRSSRLIGGNVATNFPPMKAKALYEKYCPKNGVIFDFSCGFGGRMLGALTSKNNYIYCGVEPCTETYDSLKKLGDYIEQVTGRNKIYKVIKQGSEIKLTDKENFIDFAFSSPPYFNLEKYSDEDTQCYNKYTNIEEWLENYVTPTIKNIYQYLKPNCYYAVNIADFKVGNKNIKFVDDWIKISEKIGFKFVEKIDMTLQNRRGSGFENKSKETKKEGIFVFKKGE